MRDRSALARMQQVVVAVGALAAIAWVAMHAATAPWRAAVGALVIVFGYSGPLALQCMLLRHASRGDSAPRPGAMELVRAWWAETVLVPQIFFWRQPFRWRANPDRIAAGDGRRGIVFVHGFICNRGFWGPWLRRLEADGRPFAAVSLEPVFGSIDDYAPIVDEAVRRMQEATGRPPVLVCHSMGGVAARAWLRAAREASRVHRVITIGSPHHGTWLGRFSHTPNGAQMRLASPWLAQLAQDEARRPMPPFTCWYSHCDNIVFPTTSAMLPGADNRLVRGPAHVELAFVPQVVEGSLALADAP